MIEETKRKRGQRGKGKKPAMGYTSLRVSEEVLDFYRTFPSYTSKMREVLTAYADGKMEIIL